MDKTALDQDLLDKLVQTIVEAVRPEKVILFGSWATGNAGPDSDIDLFLEVEPGRNTGQAAEHAYAAIRPLRRHLHAGVDIVVKDTAFVERYGDLVGTVLRPVLREGKVLYVR